MFEFTIIKDDSFMQLTVSDYKQASSFEQLLNDFKVAYQLHDNVTTKQDVIGSFSEREKDYLTYSDKPVLSWIDQIEQMRNETCQINTL